MMPNEFAFQQSTFFYLGFIFGLLTLDGLVDLNLNSMFMKTIVVVCC